MVVLGGVIEVGLMPEVELGGHTRISGGSDAAGSLF